MTSPLRRVRQERRRRRLSLRGELWPVLGSVALGFCCLSFTMKVDAFARFRSSRRGRYASDPLCHSGRNRRHPSATPTSSTAVSSRSSGDDDDYIPFHDVIRSLQQRGDVELMEVSDCRDATAFLSVVWHVLADLSESDDARRRCLIFDNDEDDDDDIPVSALCGLERDWISLTQHGDRIMSHLPELRRLRVSVVPGTLSHDGRPTLADAQHGRPALLLEATTARTVEERRERDDRVAFEDVFTESKTTAALRSFVTRLVQKGSVDGGGGGTCPYTASADVAGVGLEARGVRPGPVGYRFDKTSDAVRATAVFWDCVQECLRTTETELSTVLLSLPAIGPGTDGHDRFAAVVELISRNLCLFRGDAVVGLVHFHPAYRRDAIHPVDGAAYGHLPPASWLRPMLRHNNGKTDDDDDATTLTDDDLACADFQRRAPCTVINVLRASQLDKAAGPKSIVDLQIDGRGHTEKASGIVTYTRNAIRLAGIGKEALEAALEEEMLSMI